ncbi:MAG TPA: glycosyltransferase 87 family protein [Actinophytocola sp.]|jgi:alpha-1,2-mannosyltransferase|nr:glycosyltransferase 87 family protein [Actinophytocola sp.]
MSTVDLRRGLLWFLGAAGTALLVALGALFFLGSVPWWLVDFTVYRLGADTVLHGGDLYGAITPDMLTFTYPPFAALLFVPATLTSLKVAGFVWIAVESLCLVGSIWLMLEAVGLRDTARRAMLTVALGLLALLLVPVDFEFSFGQVNMLLMVLVLLDLLKGDGKRWQGVFVGIAAGIKLVPLIYLVYLAFTGRIRAAVTGLAAFLGTIAIGFALVPSGSSGFWFGSVMSMNRPGIPQSPLNQNLRGVFARMFGTDEPVNPVWLGVAAIVGLLGLAAAIALYRKGFQARSVVVAGLTALLVSPVSWIPHWVWAVPLLILLGALAWRNRSAWWLALAVVTAAVFGLRLVFWLLPMEAFYVVSTPANLQLSGWHQLVSATYAILSLGLLVILALPALRKRDAAAPAAEPAEPAAVTH